MWKYKTQGIYGKHDCSYSRKTSRPVYHHDVFKQCIPSYFCRHKVVNNSREFCWFLAFDIDILSVDNLSIIIERSNDSVFTYCMEKKIHNRMVIDFFLLYRYFSKNQNYIVFPWKILYNSSQHPPRFYGEG